MNIPVAELDLTHSPNGMLAALHGDEQEFRATFHRSVIVTIPALLFEQHRNINRRGTVSQSADRNVIHTG